MSWRGAFAGALALIALQAVVGRAESADRLGAGFAWIADLVTSALDPGVPAIPDLAGLSGYDFDPGDDGDPWGGGRGGGGGGGGSW